MKRYLFILILLIRVAYGQPSKITDTICFPLPVIQKVLIAAEQKKVLEQQVIILNERIMNYQAIISSLNQKDSVTVATYTEQIKTMQEQRAVFEDQMKGYERLLRREKRKRFLTAAGGVITTGLAAYLYLTK